MEVKIQKVSFSYDRHSNVIIDEVSIKILSNQVTGIIGNNGSGKSTLLGLLSGNHIPNKGKILIDDIVLSKKNFSEASKMITKKVGYLPQVIVECFSNKLLKDEIIDNLEELDMDLTNIDNKIVEVFNLLGLEESLLNQHSYLLSNGERRKVAIACILIYNPDVIILDEPITCLDSNSTKRLINYLTKIKKIQNKTIIVVSNNIDFINKISDSIIAIENGKVIKSEKNIDFFKDVKFLYEHKLPIPQIIEFESIVLNQKGIRLGFRDDINDLVKDVLRKC